MIKYEIPENWIKYDFTALLQELVDAKSAINAIKMIPFQRSWVDKLQELQFKREIAGTTRIEGADFTERELDEALKETPEQLITRSQKQAHAARHAYLWISKVSEDNTIDEELILEIHRRIVTGADDDHCEPGKIRKTGEDVHFGIPLHRGTDGKDCKTVFHKLVIALNKDFRRHDPIIQAIAMHYHLAAIHLFTDGNGRTARALEALMLQRAGISSTCLIPMSNYYYEEKQTYLKTLADCHTQNHDLTSFLKFCLKGIAQQTLRLLDEIRIHGQKAIFRNTMYDLFGRLKTPRKRIIAERQLKILRLLLEHDQMEDVDIFNRLRINYTGLSNQQKAFIRDITGLHGLKAIDLYTDNEDNYFIRINLDWPKEITEPEFDKLIKSLPKAKSHPFLS